MARSVSRALNVGFCFAMLSAVLLFWMRDEFFTESRFHLQGNTIILHADQSVVVRDRSDQLSTYTVGQHVNFGALQLVSVAYILSWTSWRLLLWAKQRRMPARGFDVIQ